MDKNDFIYPRHRYYGDFQPDKLLFNANLQYFSQRISFICNLQTAGKLTTDEAYEQIKTLWKQLKHTKKELKIVNNSEENQEL